MKPTKLTENVSGDINHMKQLYEMNKVLEERISSLSTAQASLDEDDDDDDDFEIFADVEVTSDDEITELPGPDGKIQADIPVFIPTKIEPVDVKEEALEAPEDSEVPDTNEDSSFEDNEVDDNERYVGHQIEDTNVPTMVEIKQEIVEMKDEKLDLNDLVLPPGWTVKISKGKLSGKPLFTCPDGRYFHAVHSAMEYMMEKNFDQADIDVMKNNLKYDGWKEVDYMPANWLVSYSKATNGYLYLSPDCRLFKSAKSVMDFMRKKNFNPSIIEDIKRTMQESKKFNSKIKYKWQEGGPTLPIGWKVRKTKGTGRNTTEVEFILSDDGIQFKSRFEALHHLINNKYSQDKIDDMRQKLLISDEKWKESEFLPAGCLYRFKGESAGREKSKTGTAMTYFSREGVVYHSMKNLMEFLATSDAYTEKDVDNCKEFMKSVVKFAERKYEWKEDPSVPPGWRIRDSDGEQESEQILSPDGVAYRSRYLAVVNLVKKGASKKEVDDMKAKMVVYEKWEQSNLLPQGWLFKVRSEGWTKEKKYYESIHYLSSEGIPFESLKTVMEYMSSSNKYSETDIKNCKEFMSRRSKSDRSYDWSDGDETILPGWKMRVTDSECKWTFFLSPENLQYRSRYVAVVDMFKRNYQRKDIEQMKKLMIKYENWETSPLLPKGWLFKIKCEGFTRDKKFYETIHYLSSEGLTFESFKAVADHIESSDFYSDLDLENCKEFISNRNKLEKAYDWEDGDETIPSGWKMRISNSENKWQFFLSPEGRQYRTRYVAILDMFKRGASTEEIEEMKESMINYEDWQRSEYLPQGWIFKIYWEGFTKAKEFTQNIRYLSREGVPYESLKNVYEFMMTKPTEYSQSDFDNCKEFVTIQNCPEKKFEWEDGDESLPKGWKKRISSADKEWILSPEGRMYRSRFVAIQDMIRKDYSKEDIEVMKSKMIDCEGWERHSLLPPGWLFKNVCEGFTKDNKWYSTLHYLSSEGVAFQSLSTVLDHIKSNPIYSASAEQAIVNCKEFLKEQKPADIKYKWQQGDETIPSGWKMRISDSENKWQFFLSPEGRQYRTRYVAILDMFKRGASTEEIEEMKESMINYEDWQRSEYLPQGWIFKIYWEGFTKAKEFTQNIRYLSREGVPYESMKNVYEFMMTKPAEYSQSDFDNCKEFVTIQNCPEKKFEWEDGDESLPKGWKMRTTNSENKWQFFLSPEGRQYRSRYVAIQDMIKRNYSSESVEVMRDLMVAHENWKRNDLLPHNWLFKINWEGQCLNKKWSDNLTYLSREGLSFESNKAAVEFMMKSSEYGEADIVKCKEFVKRRNQETQEVRFEWNEGDHTVPQGWKMRKTNDREYILSPEGIQYMTRVVALTDMVRRGRPELELEEMRGKLQYEGWSTNKFLPRGWFFKFWEGETRKQKLDRNLFFVSREGVRLESFKNVIEYMEESEVYGAQDIQNIQKYKKAEGVDLRRRTWDWSEGGDSLPSGWKRRPAVGGNDQERILSPDGEQFRSRFSALQHLVRNNSPMADIKEMKSKLSHEGWVSHHNLPKDWIYKNLYEGANANGKNNSKPTYISDDGQVFESVKSAVEFMKTFGRKYSQADIENFRKIQSSMAKTVRESRGDWLEDETVPQGWKRRVLESTGKEFILRSDGRQFTSRCNAILHMVKEGNSQTEIAKMKSKLSYEGWREEDLLPKGWLVKVSESKHKGRVQRSYKLLNREGVLLESIKAAQDSMELSGFYSAIDIENCKKFQLKESRSNASPRIQWEYESGLTPPNWKTKVVEGKRLFMMPDGNQFQSLFAAFQHMVNNDYVLSHVNSLRPFLKTEGWNSDDRLPSGWQLKTLKDVDCFIGRHGEYFDSKEKALKFILTNKDYNISDINNFKARFGIGASLKRKPEDTLTAANIKKANSTKNTPKRKSVDKVESLQVKKIKNSNVSRGL